MLAAYLRLSPGGPSRETQALTVTKALGRPVTEYVDGVAPGPGLPARRQAIHSLSTGDVLAVADAGRLGISAEDILSTLVDILGREAAVLDVSTGDSVDGRSSPESALRFAMRAARAVRSEKATGLREGRKGTARKGGAPAGRWNVAEAEARRMWADLSVSVHEVARIAGTSVPTLYRRFGARSRIAAS